MILPAKYNIYLQKYLVVLLLILTGFQDATTRNVAIQPFKWKTKRDGTMNAIFLLVIKSLGGGEITPS